MFAVIKTGGKQYRVQAGDVLQIEKLKVEEGQKITFDQVLLIDDDERTLIGTPFLKNAQVKAEVIENFKDKKIIVFKKKRRKQYKKKTGHRQELTRIKIEEIIPEIKAPPRKEPVKVKEKAEAAKAPKKEKAERKVKPKEIKEEKPKKSIKAMSAEKESKLPRQRKASGAQKPEVKASVKKTERQTASEAKKFSKIKEK